MKILTSLCWFMFGGAFTTLLINQQVIGKHQGDLVTEGERAIYNLHDVLLDYVIFFIAGTLVCLFLILAQKTRAKYIN